MSATGGPTRLLPGDTMPVPSGTVCDNHPDRVATTRLVGEVDSMGFEAHDLCDECFASTKKQQPEADNCDMCGSLDILKAIRDPDEGMAGPVYYACKSCRKALYDYHNDQPGEDE